jgi:peptidoglycan/xylan/chitin deacetylase (PgdA/CDA1 family)
MRSIIITVLLLWSVTGFSQIRNYDRTPDKAYQTIGALNTYYYSGSAPTGITDIGGTVYDSLYYRNNLDLHIIGRSGLTLPDEYGNNATILPAVFINKGGYYVGVKTRAEEHVFDGNDHTIFMEITQLLSTTGSYQILGLGSDLSGRGIQLYMSTTYLMMYCGDGIVSQVSKVVMSNVNTTMLGQGRLFLLITINATTKKINIGFYNSAGNAIATPVEQNISTFTFNANDNAQKYYFFSAFHGVSNFKKFTGIKTLSQCRDNTYRTDLQLHYPCIYGLGETVSGLNLVGINASKFINIGYSNHDDTWILDYGYDVYRAYTDIVALSDLRDIIVPHNMDGSSIVFSQVNYSFIKSVPGNLTHHNNSDSKIRFINEFYDRSDETIWADAARIGYYDASHTKDFHISELNQTTLYGMLNAGYRGKLYVKCDNNSVDDGSENFLRKGTKGVLEEILGYASDKTLTQNKNILTYTGDIMAAVLDVNNAITYDANNYVKLGLLKTTKPMITLRIDDYMPEEFPEWEDMFNDYDIVGDIIVNVGRNANPLLNHWGSTFSHLTELYNTGWGVSSHGMDDDDLSLQAESVAQTEIPESQTILRAKGFSCNNFAPHKHGINAVWVHRIASQYYTACFGWGESNASLAIANPQRMDIWNARAMPIDLAYPTAIVDQVTDAQIPAAIAAVKAQIDIAASENRWVILLFHGWTTNKEVALRDIIDYAILKGLTFVTHDQGLANRKYLP